MAYDRITGLRDAHERLKNGKTVVCRSKFDLLAVAKKFKFSLTNDSGVETIAGFCKEESINEFFIFDTPRDALDFMNNFKPEDYPLKSPAKLYS